MRCSAAESCGGIMPDLAGEGHAVGERVVGWISPSRTVTRSKPSRSIGLPVGATPPKLPGSGEGPAQAPLHGAALALGGRRDDLHAAGPGRRPISSPRKLRTPSGAITSTRPRTLSRPPGGPQRHGAVEVARVDRLEVAPRHALGLAARRCVCGSPPPAACSRPPPAPCVLASLAFSAARPSPPPLRRRGP